MISEKKYQRKQYKKIYEDLQLNTLQFSFYERKTCVLTEIFCFVGIDIPRSCLVWVAYNKTNIPFFYV